MSSEFQERPRRGGFFGKNEWYVRIRRVQSRPLYSSRHEFLFARQPILLARLPIDYHRRHARAQPSSAPLHPQVCLVAMPPQHGHLAPLRLIVPAPRAPSSRLLGASDSRSSSTPLPSSVASLPAARACRRACRASASSGGESGPAVAAFGDPRPQVRYRGLGDPAGVAWILQIQGVELRIEAVNGHAPWSSGARSLGGRGLNRLGASPTSTVTPFILADFGRERAAACV